MITKMYALLWLIGLFAVGITYVTDNLSPMMVILFGFLSFGAIFMGMIGVLPLVSTHQKPTKH